MDTIFAILILMALLVLTVFTAASETSIIAASRIKLRRLSSEGSRIATLILKILETPEKFFGTILVANNIVNTLIASIVTVMAISVVKDEGRGVFIATALVTLAIIICEVVSKTFAARHSVRVALALARPVQLLIIVLSPAVKILAKATNMIINVLGGHQAKKDAALVTAEEIRAMIKVGEEDDALHRERYKMLSKVFDFSEAVVKNVMTQKKEMVAIDVDGKFEDILERVLESGYSRFPVYKSDPDNIIGTINMKDLLNLSCNKGLVVFQDIIYPPKFVAETKNVGELLKEFQKGHTHIAIVVDARNKIQGIITLEDLLEEIVGEIEDEYDLRAR